ncbi:hypothetical protein DAI22_04g284750 [Oryza sativa Japonica Group]|nr:hypothetical protein DAI22_04g284750 [Oryza sativa Japonica Group]
MGQSSTGTQGPINLASAAAQHRRRRTPGSPRGRVPHPQVDNSNGRPRPTPTDTGSAAHRQSHHPHATRPKHPESHAKNSQSRRPAPRPSFRSASAALPASVRRGTKIRNFHR